MNFLRSSSRIIALPLIALMLAVTMPAGIARAALVGTDQIITRADIDADRARIAAFLDRADVRQEMERMGVSPAEASARVDGLTDSEVQTIATRMDAMPAGQGAFEAILGAVVLIFLVLLVTDLLGLTDVFPFVKGGRAPR